MLDETMSKTFAASHASPCYFAQPLHGDAANVLQELALGRLLRFLSRPSDGAPSLNVLCCCEDTGSTLRLREPLAALLRFIRALVGTRIDPLLLDLLAQLCDQPLSLLPMLTSLSSATSSSSSLSSSSSASTAAARESLASLAPLFPTRLAAAYSLPQCTTVAECEPYKLPVALVADLITPLCLMFLVRAPPQMDQ